MFIIYNRRKHLGTRYTKQQQILLQSNEKYNACYVVSLFFCKAVRYLYTYVAIYIYIYIYIYILYTYVAIWNNWVWNDTYRQSIMYMLGYVVIQREQTKTVRNRWTGVLSHTD